MVGVQRLGGDGERIGATSLHFGHLHTPRAIGTRESLTLIHHLAVLAQHASYFASCIGTTFQQEGLVARQDHSRGINRRQMQPSVVARECRIDGLCQDLCTFGIGMQGIGEEVRTTVQRRVEVDELCSCAMCHQLDGLLNLCVPVACAALEARMAMEDGRHLADQDTRLGVRRAEGINQGTVVRDEFLLPVGPVARVGVVQAKMDDHPVGLEVQRFAELRQMDVGTMPLI